MIRRKSKTCVYSILESLLKRKWFLCILRQLSNGQSGVDMISRVAPDMPVQVMNGRLRTLLRYGLVSRSYDRVSDYRIEYRLTEFGRKVTQILAAVDELNREYGFPSGEEEELEPRGISVAPPPGNARRSELMLDNGNQNGNGASTSRTAVKL